MSNQNEALLDKAMSMLGLSMDMKTNPDTICSVLKGMKLNDFQPSLEPMQKFLEAAKTESQPLRPMFNAIRQGIMEDHPAIMEFIQKVVDESWFSKSESIYTSVHIAYILEALTTSAANNNQFLEEIQDHFLNKRAEYGIEL